MRKVVRLTESDLVRIVKRVINEELETSKPKMKKYNYKIGDILYSTGISSRGALKFKITKISNDGYELNIDGAITGINGEFTGESPTGFPWNTPPSAKVGDPISIRVAITEPQEFWTLYLPKTGLEMEYASGDHFSKKFTKI